MLLLFDNELFLSKAEFDYLTASRHFSNDYSYTIKCRLQKKIERFARKELPLLVGQGYLDLTEFSKLTEYCKESNAKVGQVDRTLALEDDYSNCTVRSSIADERVIPNDNEEELPDSEEFKNKCSGRDLNPGSATRKAAMLDRTVQPQDKEMVTTPPEQSQTL